MIPFLVGLALTLPAAAVFFFLWFYPNWTPIQRELEEAYGLGGEQE